MNGIVFLQETHSIPSDSKHWASEWQGNIYLSSGTSASRGVAILTPKNMVCNIKETTKDDTGRFLMLKGDFNGLDMTLMNIYAPTADKTTEQQEFLQFLLPYIEQNNDSLVWGGDFNTHLKSEDKHGKEVKITKFATTLQNIMHELSLIDIWRVTHEDTLRFTWRNKMKTGLQQSRLDFFLLSESLIYKVNKCEIKYAIYSDHSPVLLELDNPNMSKRGRGYWKFNCSLLRDEEYVKRIQKVISEEEENNKNIVDKGLKWDLIKMLIRSSTVSYTAYKAKKTREYELSLKNELEKLQEQLANNPNDDVQQHYYTNIKELELINNERTRGAQIRAHALHVELNETNSKYFLNKEINNAKIKNITCLNLENGNKITEMTEIIEHQKEYFETLYTEPKGINKWDEEEATESFCSDNALPVLNDEDKDKLEQSIDMSEIAIATKALPNQKAPGCDGIPADFYKKNWKDIKYLVRDSITYAAQQGKMSLDQRRGVLSLIPKKDKDIRLLTNWRPLTLLNTDYKIYAKALATRLQTVLPMIISGDQSGCMKGRSTFNNIRSTLDVITFVNDKHMNGIIAYIDFQKAFDTVRWSFMYTVMQKMVLVLYVILK
jgi:exonuclease III